MIRGGLAAVVGTLTGLGSPVVAQDPPPLFAADDLVSLTLRADLEALRGDRSESPDRVATLTVPALGGGDPITLEIEVRTRGNFRLDPSNCSFPPLRIDIPRSAAEGSLFEDQDKLKVVSSCRPGRPSYDELVVTEYLAYRTLRLVTGRSFAVRLIELTLVDDPQIGSDDATPIDPGSPSEPGAVSAEATNADLPAETRIAFLIEEDEALAERLRGTVFELEEGKHLPATGFDPVSTVTVGIFAYMIGNPDWSEVAGHNVEIVDRGGVAIAVPYDFDSSGLVDAPYATPPPDYRLSSVRERIYRGWCANPVTTRAVLGSFRNARDPILRLWNTFEPIADETRRRAVGYLERFFEDIATDERAERRFLRDCRALPTGRP